MVCTADGFGLLRRMIPYNPALLLCLAAAVEEGHDLRSCAVVAGAEQTAADTAGDLVLLCLRNCVCIVSVRRYITECAAAADGWAAGSMIEEGHGLLTSAGSIQAELAVAGTDGDAVLNRPCHSLGVVAVGRNIGKAARIFQFGRAGCTPQEGDNLRAGAGGVGGKMHGIRAGGDSLLHRPQHRIIEVVIGLDIIKESIAAAYPNTEYQRCIVHQVRNTLKYVAEKDKKAFANDLKSIYHAPNEESGYERMQAVTEKWHDRYPNAMKRWEENWDVISPMFKFSADVRKVMYTTNAIESLNRALRRLNSQRSVFPSDTALLKALYLATFEATKKWTMPLRNWGKVYGELSIMYDGRLF